MHDHRRTAVGFFGNWAKHHERQKMTEAELREYRDNIEFPMEMLAITLHDLGYKVENLDDHEVVKAAKEVIKLFEVESLCFPHEGCITYRSPHHHEVVPVLTSLHNAIIAFEECKKTNE